VESVAVALAVVQVLVVLVAFCYSVLGERALVAFHAGLRRRVFGRLSLPDRHPEQCYHIVTRCGHHLVVVLVLVSVFLPGLSPSAAAAWEEWEQEAWVQFVEAPAVAAQGVFSPALAGLAAVDEAHLALAAAGEAPLAVGAITVWQQATEVEV
jgi:hypothetical protein